MIVSFLDGTFPDDLMSCRHQGGNLEASYLEDVGILDSQASNIEVCKNVGWKTRVVNRGAFETWCTDSFNKKTSAFKLGMKHLPCRMGGWG